MQRFESTAETIPMLKNFVDVGYKRSELIRERKKQMQAASKMAKNGVWMPEGMHVCMYVLME